MKFVVKATFTVSFIYKNDKKLTDKKYYKCENYTKILHNRLFYSEKKLHLLFLRFIEQEKRSYTGPLSKLKFDMN